MISTDKINILVNHIMQYQDIEILEIIVKIQIHSKENDKNR